MMAINFNTGMGASTGEDGSGARPAPSEQKAQCGRRFSCAGFCLGCCSPSPAAIHFNPVDAQIGITNPLCPGLAFASRGHSALNAMASKASQKPNRRVDCLGSMDPRLYHSKHRRSRAPPSSGSSQNWRFWVIGHWRGSLGWTAILFGTTGLLAEAR